MNSASANSPPANTTAIAPEIFRAYDIRGVVPDQLNEDNLWSISRAVASEALERGITQLLLAHDGRLSSDSLYRVLKEGVLSTGCNVIELGLIPTPVLYFATHHTSCDSGLMLTASHNPANYNGLKMVFARTSLTAEQIQSIKARSDAGQIVDGAGTAEKLDILPDYLATVSSRIKLTRKLRVVVDCGNAVPGVIAPQVFEQLGCEVIPLYCDVDGRFPNHHPDPTVAANLAQLKEKVLATKADIGLAFDGDGDRLGIVTEKGAAVSADQLLMVLAEEILPRYPGAPVVFDVKCSSALAKRIATLGGVPVMHRSGHSFMKQKMQETNAPLGGEYSAHIFLQDRWFGFDDGIYAAARVIEILARQAVKASDLFDHLINGVDTAEIALPVAEQRKFALMDEIAAQADFPDANVITLDGLRVEWPQGWGLLRASNTSPALLLRFEADDADALEDIKSRFKALIMRADKSIDLNPI